MPDPFVLMIRPEPQSRAFLKAFTVQTGLETDVIFSPVLGIVSRQGVALPADASLLVFTSVNSVALWSELTSDRKPRAFCVGKNTAEAARAQGFAAESADGTGEDLLSLILSNAQEADRIYYLSGNFAALDLAQALQARGYNARRIVLYDQLPLPLTQTALDVLERKPVIVPVFSPRTARYFVDQIAGKPMHDCRFLCISANAAAPLEGLSAPIEIASAPTRDAMITALNMTLRNFTAKA
ncbi:MAG: uroporphyrinogen-III synthase [Rhodobacteraceae bacterium]|nr:uroporphyrinogen-III synthase [Paracoccaceae bacterium]